MKKIETSLTDFLGTVSGDFIGLLGKIEQMRENMTRLIEDRKTSESMKRDQQILLGVPQTPREEEGDNSPSQNIRLSPSDRD